MTLRAEYSLGHSPYNDFLFATAGVEGRVGEASHDVTLLSALTRLHLDPWQVAERLSDLTREEAGHQLLDLLVTLPEIGWSEADGGRAAELVSLLPTESVGAVPLVSEAAGSRDRSESESERSPFDRRSRMILLLLFAMILVIFILAARG